MEYNMNAGGLMANLGIIPEREKEIEQQFRDRTRPLTENEEGTSASEIYNAVAPISQNENEAFYIGLLARGVVEQLQRRMNPMNAILEALHYY